jgi:DNA-directed RNA polymerase subunit RPC12/RpoP
MLDPVFRCVACRKLVRKDKLKETGCCYHCGNKRVAEIRVFSEEEYEKMKKWGVDDEFFGSFVRKDDDDDDNS